VDETFDIIEERVILLSLLHHRLLSMHCSDCSAEQQEELNCGCKYREEPVLYEPTIQKEVFACPIRMIPKEIFELYDKFAFVQEFGGVGAYQDCDALYWWFHKTYLHYSNKHSIQKMELDSKSRGLK